MNEALVKLLPGYSAVDKGFYPPGKSAGLEMELLSSPGDRHIYQVREEISFFQEDYFLLLSPYMPENIKSAESFERPRSSEFSFLFAYTTFSENISDGRGASLSLNFYRLFVKVDSQGILSYYLTDFL